MSGHQNRKPTCQDVKLGEKIRTRRILAGLSQDELGTALGVTFQQIQKYERGTNRVTFVRLQEIAKILGESVDYFIVNGKPLSKTAQTMHSAMTDPHTVRLVQAFNKIKSNDKSLLVIHMAESLEGQ